VIAAVVITLYLGNTADMVAGQGQLKGGTIMKFWTSRDWPLRAAAGPEQTCDGS